MEIMKNERSSVSEDWLDTDADDDGHTDANDDAPYDDDHY
jgi:hypothetical protein